MARSAARIGQVETPVASYSLPARLGHWVVALLIIVAFFAGLTMVRVGQGSLQDRLFDWHRSLGVLILALATARLIWRIYRPAPPLPAGIPRWIETASRASHWLLYALILGLPLLGWLGSSAFGAPVRVFGLFDLPPLVRPNRPLADVILAIHKYGAFSLGGLVVLHVGAAFYHLLVRRDGVFQRMTG